MCDFLIFFNQKRKSFPMHLDISYSKVADWAILIYKKGCAADYPGATTSGDDVIICSLNECDMELAFAKAQIALKEWLSEYEGGY